MSDAKFHVGFVLFPNITQLDMTGPFEVLSRMPNAKIDVLWKHHETVRSDTGLGLLPTATFDEIRNLDLVCVPGGPGVGDWMQDQETLEFLRRIAPTARYITSVCTGALVLGAAGLLKGKRATTHWMSHDLLAPFGAIPVQQRVVEDGKIITGGGVTAGIDFALTVVAAVAGETRARQVQLAIEYDPTPPFDSGSPASATAELVTRTREAGSARQQERAEIVARAAALL
jgi:cyclohexyl-isocyanide hydratase